MYLFKFFYIVREVIFWLNVFEDIGYRFLFFEFVEGLVCFR